MEKMDCLQGVWVDDFSKSSLISKFPDDDFIFCEENADCWGRVFFDSHGFLVGYRNIGIKPVGIDVDDQVLVGINGFLISRSEFDKGKNFIYSMPFVFQEFALIENDLLVVRDEIGFVGLRLDGNEVWKFCPGTIESYTVDGRRLRGVTEEGEVFDLQI